MRRCAKCEDDKDDEEFGWKNRQKGARDSYCKPCRREYNKGHYKAQKGLYLDRNARSMTRMRIFLRSLKEGRPCADCGGSFPPCVMDFDHRDPQEKSEGVAQIIRHGSKKALLAEIEKCDLVCANCHRIRTCSRDHDHAHEA